LCLKAGVKLLVVVDDNDVFHFFDIEGAILKGKVVFAGVTF
jgi:hypothetical protein